ncbi:jg22964, partial [Pararge aegeria aegeria]
SPRDSFDVVCPPYGDRPTLRLPVWGCHSNTLGPTPTFIGSPSNVPHSLPLQHRDSLSNVGNAGSSTDLLISDLMTWRYSNINLHNGLGLEPGTFHLKTCGIPVAYHAQLYNAAS